MPLPENPYENPRENPVKLWKHNFGAREVAIHGTVFTLKATDLILDRLTEVRAKYSEHAKVPAMEGEEPEKYKERANRILEHRRLFRQEGESAEDWTKRQYKSSRSAPYILLELLNLVLELSSQPQLTYEDIQDAHWPSAKEFVFEMLWLGAGLYVDELVSPKS
ncbi:MAG: hypothetical protein EKK48_29860 [Candidatus Melainabacteria bacterium]|nr:MAG: hypothetical protein EKK48_29860 [Candidatus Melainabacteria bacterium]